MTDSYITDETTWHVPYNATLTVHWACATWHTVTTAQLASCARPTALTLHRQTHRQTDKVSVI